jgi:hypothetical protein
MSDSKRYAQVSVVISGRGIKRVSVFFPPEMKSVLAAGVRPEGTFHNGLVLHCSEAPRRGVSYAVQDVTNGPRLDLPGAFAGVDLKEPKRMTNVGFDATVVDGRAIVVFDRIDLNTLPYRMARHYPNGKKLNGSGERTLPAIDLDAPEIEQVRAAMRVLKGRVRDPGVGQAIAVLCNLAHIVNADVQWNGTELVAQIVHRL